MSVPRYSEEWLADRLNPGRAGQGQSSEAIPQVDQPSPAQAALPLQESKYHNVKTDGEDSKRQAKRLKQLRLLNLSGKIRGLARQVEYVLVPKQCDEWGAMLERPTKYLADFQYEEYKDGRWQIVTEDTKGVTTPDYIIKRKLMLRVHGIVVNEI